MDEAEHRDDINGHRARHANKDTLFVTDEEMYKRMGVPAAIARVVVRKLDENKLSGFPRKQPLWGGRRYWPAVEHYFDQTLLIEYPPLRTRPR